MVINYRIAQRGHYQIQSMVHVLCVNDYCKSIISVSYHPTATDFIVNFMPSSLAIYTCEPHLFDDAWTWWAGYVGVVYRQSHSSCTCVIMSVVKEFDFKLATARDIPPAWYELVLRPSLFQDHMNNLHTSCGHGNDAILRSESIK